jgi:hypothetical protein
MPLEGYESTDAPYTGLTKDQLLECAYRPVWVRVRCTLLVAYWTSWVAMLAGAITLILVTPKCSAPESLQWWQIFPMYQIYSLSYQDGNHPPDGVGDIPGMFCCYDYVLNGQTHSRKASGRLGTQEIPGCPPIVLILNHIKSVDNSHPFS